jgi:hypothetical protein
MAMRAELLRSAEASLASGKTAQALTQFDQAAMLLHAADTEMGLVRSYLQAGDYRRALAFCAHTAGAHLDAAPASALYAWLLRAGGQAAFAQRVLGEALARVPSDAVLNAVQREFEQAWPQARGVLLEPPHRMAPHGVLAAGSVAVAETSQVLSSGVLIDQGRRALVPLGSMPASGAGPLWVRNGLGQTTTARLDPGGQPLPALGVAVLLLAAPLQLPEGLTLAPRDPYAGSQGFAVEYAALNGASAAWPWLHQGFFGGYFGAAGLRRLGVNVPAGPHGGPVFDAAGRLAGITLPGPGVEPVMLPVSLWKEWAGAANGGPVGAAAPMPADEAYERSLRVGLQLIGGR